MVASLPASARGILIKSAADAPPGTMDHNRMCWGPFMDSFVEISFKIPKRERLKIEARQHHTTMDEWMDRLETGKPQIEDGLFTSLRLAVYILEPMFYIGLSKNINNNRFKVTS